MCSEQRKQRGVTVEPRRLSATELFDVRAKVLRAHVVAAEEDLPARTVVAPERRLPVAKGARSSGRRSGRTRCPARCRASAGIATTRPTAPGSRRWVDANRRPPPVVPLVCTMRLRCRRRVRRASAPQMFLHLLLREDRQPRHVVESFDVARVTIPASSKRRRWNGTCSKQCRMKARSRWSRNARISSGEESVRASASARSRGNAPPKRPRSIRHPATLHAAC